MWLFLPKSFDTVWVYSLLLLLQTLYMYKSFLYIFISLHLLSCTLLYSSYSFSSFLVFLPHLYSYTSFPPPWYFLIYSSWFSLFSLPFIFSFYPPLYSTSYIFCNPFTYILSYKTLPLLYFSPLFISSFSLFSSRTSFFTFYSFICPDIFLASSLFSLPFVISLYILFFILLSSLLTFCRFLL